jgi:broad specificity phosphatase PhoE
VTCFLLIRHGETDHTGSVLSGRLPDVHLNQRGRKQAADLPRQLKNVAPELVCSSPLERTRQTAEPLAREYGLEPRILPDLLELDYGDWTGARPASLDGGSYWQLYNRHRSTCRIPGGEMLVEAQQRMFRALATLEREMPGARVAVVGHSDPIKAILGYLLGLPLDFINRLRVDPASVSIATLGPGEPRVHCVNHSGEVSRALFD